MFTLVARKMPRSHNTHVLKSSIRNTATMLLHLSLPLLTLRSPLAYTTMLPHRASPATRTGGARDETVSCVLFL